MSKLTETFTNIFKIQELRERLLFTTLLLIIVRIGSHITVPGVDAVLLADTIKKSSENTLFGLYDLFVGGAFSHAAIFALGIMPYISSSIVIQLLGAVVPYFAKLQKEGEEGRKKITQYTRYGTVAISLMQATGVVAKLMSTSTAGIPIVPESCSRNWFLFKHDNYSYDRYDVYDVAWVSRSLSAVLAMEFRLSSLSVSWHGFRMQF